MFIVYTDLKYYRWAIRKILEIIHINIRSILIKKN